MPCSGWIICNCLNIPCFLIIHTSADGHLSCYSFWLLWTVLLRKFVRKPLSTCFQFFWVKRILLKGIELLDKLVSLYLLRNCQLFSTVVYHFTFSPAEYKGFNFSTSSSTFVIFKSFFLFNAWMWNSILLWFLFASPRGQDHPHAKEMQKSKMAV